MNVYIIMTALLSASVGNEQSAVNDAIANDDGQVVNSDVQVSVDYDSGNVVHDLEPQNYANKLHELQRACYTIKSPFDLAAKGK